MRKPNRHGSSAPEYSAAPIQACSVPGPGSPRVSIVCGALPKHPLSSCLVEIGETRVIAVLEGPYPLPKKSQNAGRGVLAVFIHHAGIRDEGEEDLAPLLQVSFESIVMLERHPRMGIDIHFHVLGDGGSAFSACCISGSQCLAMASVDMLDLLVGLTLIKSGSAFSLEPSREDQRGALSTVIRLSYSPSLKLYSNMHILGAPLCVRDLPELEALVAKESDALVRLMKGSLSDLAKK